MLLIEIFVSHDFKSGHFFSHLRSIYKLKVGKIIIIIIIIIVIVIVIVEFNQNLNRTNFNKTPK
jgi:uncharacterized membrane protein YkvI